jgi:SAM-dependent methyltransferase
MFDACLTMRLIIIGIKDVFADSTELQYASSRLLSSLPASATRVFANVDDWAALEKFAVVQVDAAGLMDGDHVLLLAHAALMPAPGTLAALAAALDAGAGAALAFDSRHPCPALGPDYFTVRGIERYAASLAKCMVFPYGENPFPPSVLMLSAGQLRRGDWRASVVCVPGAYAHDFSSYHQGRREEVISLVPVAASCVLDVGGGEGGFLEALKAARACETHLAEFSETACLAASSRVDRVWPGDFMRSEFDKKFDCITFLDVLEHTEWPAQWLVRARQLLRTDGCVIASIPNVGHWSVVADLLEGRWDYAPAGIHCITHLRFFTKVGVEQLMAEAGYEIVTIEATRSEIPEWFNLPEIGGRLVVDREALATYSFLILARPYQ